MAIPWLEGRTIENRSKIHGIATPVCALIRNDRSIEGTTNGNLPFWEKGENFFVPLVHRRFFVYNVP